MAASAALDIDFGCGKACAAVITSSFAARLAVRNARRPSIQTMRATDSSLLTFRLEMHLHEMSQLLNRPACRPLRRRERSNVRQMRWGVCGSIGTGDDRPDAEDHFWP